MSIISHVRIRRAVECCPTSTELWLALAKLESHLEARRVLNTAIQHIPNDPVIYITAAQLEEANDNQPMCEKIVSKAIEQMAKNQVSYLTLTSIALPPHRYRCLSIPCSLVISCD